MNLSGNTVLVTGGTSGIGLALAEAFLAAGSQVAVCGRRKGRLDELRRKYPGLHVRACDVGRVEDCRALADWAGATLPGLNVLVNNAGVQRDLDFTRGAEEFLEGENEVRINLEAPILLSGFFVPLLAGKPGAAIVNVSSGLGFVPAARVPVYSATKAGLHAFSMGLRFQLAPIGIEVHELVPPAVDTELNPEGRARRGAFQAGVTAEEFVATAMKGLEAGALEIGHGFSAGLLRATRDELDERFRQMNGRW